MGEDGKPAQHWFHVDADVTAADGGSDGAYSLLGVWTAEEFCLELRSVLSSSVNEMLMRGKDHFTGHTLSIRIRDATPEEIAEDTNKR